MPRHVALLRGINVGGHRRVPMPRLRELLSAAGYDGVQTLVQSGNVVLTSRAGSERLRGELERLIEAEFGFSVQIVMRTRDELAEVIARNPLDGVASEPKYYQVTFLSGEPDPVAARKLAEADFGAERCVVSGREIYAWYPEGMQRSGLARSLADAKLGVTATARNWNTITKLLELAGVTLHRRQPEVGMRVTIVQLASRSRATIREVADGGRRLVAVTDGGGELVFALSRATGRFMEDGNQTGARLLFEDAAD